MIQISFLFVVPLPIQILLIPIYYGSCNNLFPGDTAASRQPVVFALIVRISQWC